MRRSARLRAAGPESPDGTGGIAGKLAKSVQPPARGRKRVGANVTAEDAEKHHFFDKSQPDKAVPAVAGDRKRSSKALDTVAEKKSSGRRKAAEAPEAKVAAMKPGPAKKAKAKAGSPMPDRQMEIDLWKQGHARVAGVDEAGRGPLAGPVVAAACILPQDADAELLAGINDSKDVDEQQREEIFERLIKHPGVRYGIGIKSHEEIDQVNILQATMLAMSSAVAQIPAESAPDYILIDGNRCPGDLSVPARAVVGGDAKVTAIAAASILAKVTRDRIMLDLDKRYPQYQFAKHKGYGTFAHRQLIHEHGPSKVHRKSFNPVKTMLGWTPPEGYSK